MLLEIVPGLYKLQRAANIYVLDNDEITVIDTGMPGATRAILKAVAELGREPQDVRHILITHADFDHIGSVAGLVEATGAAVYASEAAAHYMSSPEAPPHGSLPLIEPMMRAGFKLMIKPFAPDFTVKDGDMLDIAGGIRVIATPGHTPDNISFYWERRRVLFCADLIMNMDRLVLTPKRISHNLEAAKRSARKVLALDPAVIAVGHGKPFYVQDAPGEIDVFLKTLV